MFFSSTTIINNINNPLLLYILFIILNVFVNYTISTCNVSSDCNLMAIAGETWLLNLGCSPVGENGHNDYKCEFSGNTISNDLIMLGIFRLLLVGILYLAMYFMKGGR